MLIYHVYAQMPPAEKDGDSGFYKLNLRYAGTVKANNIDQAFERARTTTTWPVVLERVQSATPKHLLVH